MSHDAGATAVVFDIGNVLIRWDLRALYRTVFDDEAEMERFLAEVWTAEHNLRCDGGEPFAAVMAEVIAAHPHYEAQIRAADERWVETVPGVVEGMFELMAELIEAGVPTYGLTNFSAETFPRAVAAYPRLGDLKQTVVSGEFGVTKPDRRIFEILCELTGVTPSTTVFVDDSPANTAAAAELGFRTVTFVDEPSLRRELVLAGLPLRAHPS